MSVFTPEQPNRNSISSSDSGTIIKENTKLKMQLFDLVKENHKLCEQLAKERSDVASLQQQIQAQQIAHQCNIELYEQQMQIYRQNQNECLEQMRLNYSPEKGHTTKNLHQRYVEDIELIKRELLAKCKEIYNKELQNITQKLEERYKFQIRTFEHQLQQKDAQLLKYKEMIKERDKKWRQKYEFLKRSGRTPPISPPVVTGNRIQLENAQQMVPQNNQQITQQNYHQNIQQDQQLYGITHNFSNQIPSDPYQTPSNAVHGVYFSGIDNDHNAIEMSPEARNVQSDHYEEINDQQQHGISIPVSVTGSGGQRQSYSRFDDSKTSAVATSKGTQNDYSDHLYGSSMRSFTDDRPAVETDLDVYQKLQEIQEKATQLKKSLYSDSQTSFQNSNYSQPAHIEIPIMPTTQENVRITQLSSMNDNNSISQQLDAYKFDIPDELALV